VNYDQHMHMRGVCSAPRDRASVRYPAAAGPGGAVVGGVIGMFAHPKSSCSRTAASSALAQPFTFIPQAPPSAPAPGSAPVKNTAEGNTPALFEVALAQGKESVSQGVAPVLRPVSNYLGSK
jgi:hypothetical protein